MIRGTAKGVHNLTMVWGAAMRLCYILQYPMYTVVSTVGSLLLVVGESIHTCIYISVRLDIDVLLLFSHMHTGRQGMIFHNVVGSEK